MPLPSSMDATWLNGSVSFNAQELRRADASIFTGDGNPLGVLGGIVRHSDTSLDVSVSVADVVTIQPGAVVIPGNSGVGNGCYRTALGAVETGNLTARNATNPRIDLLVYRVLDDDVITTHDAYTARIELIAGTPAASPVAPALPAMAVELARITVPATAGGAASVDKSFRMYAAATGGKLPVQSAARLPAVPNPKFLEAVALDTGIEYWWDGAAWQARLSASGVSNIVNLPGNLAWIKARRRDGCAEIWGRWNVTGAAGPNLRLSLTWPADALAGNGSLPTPVGTVLAYRAGVNYFRGVIALVDATNAYLYTDNLGTWGPTVPAAFVSGDLLSFHLSYPLA